MSYRIFFSNLGYARDIDGSLWTHIRRMHRHIYCPLSVQQQVIMQVKSMLAEHRPNLCCFVEIDEGSAYSGNYNQMQALLDDTYKFHDIADKYGPGSRLGRMPFHAGKSNGLMSMTEIPFERMYFIAGTKRLLYHITLEDNIHVLFTHFSLIRSVRSRQFEEISQLIRKISGPIIVLGDFNIMHGFGELEPLLRDSGLHLMNSDDIFTFRFHRRYMILDLCLCSDEIRNRLNLKIVPQPFSDHAALLVEISEKPV